MAFSLRSLFKRKEAEEKAPPPPPAVVDKPSADRFSKTVMPNATRVSGASDPFAGAMNSAPAAIPATPAPPRPSISMNAPASRTSHHLPPAVAVALDPKVERALPFTLADVVSEMPPGFVRQLTDAEAGQRILLKAAELERGMANGRPAVSVATIYEQVPEIFVRPIAPSDSTQVPLPFIKVLEQFTSVQMRADQQPEHAVPQVETPFLQVTLEDDKKFGTTTRPTMGADLLPPVRVQPATAETIAAAEPEPAAKAKFIPPTPAPTTHVAPETNGNGHSLTRAAAPPAREEKPVSAPTRIPFKLTPNGAGAPAAERVPASSGGASVPTSAPAGRSETAAPAPATPPPAPTRIPFKLSAATPAPPAAASTVTPPPPTAQPVETWLSKETFPTSGSAAPAKAPLGLRKKTVPTISLPLKPILEGLPPFQLAGDISTVKADARIEVALALVEPQLATGRVSLSADDFAAALPENHQSLFSSKDIAAPVVLPLQDVLQNMPAAALRMRDDQEEQERGANYATPFAATAEEDAKRFKMSTAPLAKPVVEEADEPVAEEIEEEPIVEPEDETPEPAKRTALQEEFATDDSLDPRDVVTRVEKIAGVKACALMFGDGLNLAGKLPERYETEGLCASAPSMMQRIENHLVDTNLGELRGLTLACTEASVTFFMQDNLCLAALHEETELSGAVRAQLDRIVRALSETYSQPA